MARKSPLMVEVSSAGQRIGAIEPSEFMLYCGRFLGLGSGRALSDLVAKFNESKVSLGEPERVAIVLAKGGA